MKDIKRTQKLNSAIGSFIDHFVYYPAYPPNIDFGEDEFAELLHKCVADDFDYTIKKYGTIPKNEFSIPDTVIA